jgi:hypothetical protein
MKKSEHDRRVRLEQAYRRLGTRTPRCALCTETDPIALTGTHPVILCYEHAAQQSGRSPIEQHHPDGRHNDPTTLPLPGNEHRILSDKMRDWPIETLRNPDGSPLLKAAAAIRSFLDYLVVLIDRVLVWIPPFLEQLDFYLREELGERWWEGSGWSHG